MGLKNFISEYIEAVQRALARFSVGDNLKYIRRGDEKFLIFELLDFSSERPSERVFRPSVSDRLPLNKEDLKRLGSYDPELIKADNGQLVSWPRDGEKHLRKLIQSYENKEIPGNLGATGLIYQAWKQGRFCDGLREDTETSLFIDTKEQHCLRKPEDSFYTRNSSENPSIEDILKIMADALKVLNPGINRFIDGTEWLQVEQLPDKALDKKFDKKSVSIELSLIHKIDKPEDNKNEEDFFLIHYPLIIDGYWFVGLAYLLKTGEAHQEAEIFRKEKYPKCYGLLVDTVAKLLKKALLDKAIDEANWNTSIQDVLLEVAKKCFTCFDVGKPKSDNTVHLQYSNFKAYPDFKIDIYVPSWASVFNDDLKKEIEYLCLEVRRRESERISAQLKQRTDLSAVFLHTFVKRGYAASGLLSNLYVSDGQTTKGKNLKEIKELYEKDRTEIISRNMHKAYRLRKIVDWYISDADILYECVSYNQAFKFAMASSAPPAIDGRRNLAVIMLKAFADAMIVSENFNELAGGYKSIFGVEDELTPYPDWLRWKLQLNKGERYFIDECRRFTDRIKQFHSQKHNKLDFSILLESLSTIQLAMPIKAESEKDVDYEKRRRVYFQFWEKIFIECFINFVRAYNTPQTTPAWLNITLERRDSMIIVCMSNPTTQPIFGERTPIGPSEEGGRKGLGLSGNNLLLKETMEVGRFTAEVTEGVRGNIFHGRIYFEKKEAFQFITPQ